MRALDRIVDVGRIIGRAFDPCLASARIYYNFSVCRGRGMYNTDQQLQTSCPTSTSPTCHGRMIDCAVGRDC